jgi:hypothetical protein
MVFEHSQGALEDPQRLFMVECRMAGRLQSCDALTLLRDNSFRFGNMPNSFDKVTLFRAVAHARYHSSASGLRQLPVLDWRMTGIGGNLASTAQDDGVI